MKRQEHAETRKRTGDPRGVAGLLAAVGGFDHTTRGRIQAAAKILSGLYPAPRRVIGVGPLRGPTAALTVPRMSRDSVRLCFSAPPL